MAVKNTTMHNPVASTASVITASSTTVSSTNSDYTNRLFINYGTADIWLGIGTQAELNNGIKLSTDGGYYEMSRAMGNLYQGDITAIADTTATTINMLVASGEA